MALSALHVDDYVDYLCIDKTWRVATVIQVFANAAVVHVRMMGKMLRDEVQLNSYKIAPFRTRSKGGSYLDIGITAAVFSQISVLRSGFAHILDMDLSHESPSIILNNIRGSLYFFTDFVLNFHPMTEAEYQLGFGLITDVVRIFQYWLEGAETHLAYFSMLQKEPKSAYLSSSYALASIWPEVFLIIERVLGSEVESLSFFAVIDIQSSVAKNALSRNNYQSFALYFWGESIGVELFIQVMQRVSRSLCGPLLSLSINFPIWDFLIRHISELVETPNYISLFLTFISILEAAISEDLDLFELSKVWKVVDACWNLFGKLGREEGKKAAGLGLDMCRRMVGAGRLEKRVEAANLTETLIQKAAKDTSFSYFLQSWSSTVAPAFFSDPHPETLQRSKSFLMWLQAQGLLPKECLANLFRSAISAHDSYSASVFECLLNVMAKGDGDDSGIVDALRSMESKDIDVGMLGFLSNLVKKTKQADALRTELIRMLQPIVTGETEAEPELRTAAITAYVSALRSNPASIQTLIENQLQIIQSGFSQKHSLEFLSQLITSLSDQPHTISSSLSHFTSTYRISMLDFFIAVSERLCPGSTIEPWQEDEMKSLLKIIEADGMLRIHEKMVQVSRVMLTNKCMAVRDLFLEFLGESKMRVSDGELFQHILITDSFEDFYRRLTPPQYLYFTKLFLQANSSSFETHKGRYYCRISPHIIGTFSLLSVVVLARNTEIVKAATGFLIEILVFTLQEDQEGLQDVVGMIIARERFIEKGGEFLVTLEEFQRKHEGDGRSERDLDECVDRVLSELSSNFPTSSEQIRFSIRDTISEMTAKFNKPYFVIRVSVDENSTFPPKLLFTAVKYNPVEVSVVVDRYLQGVRKAIGNGAPLAAKAACKLLKTVCVRSRLSASIKECSSTYSEYLNHQDITHRTIFLLILESLSSSPAFSRQYLPHCSDLTMLLELLKVDSTAKDIAQHYKHRVVLYCEALLGVMKQYFNGGGGVLSEEQVTIVIHLFNIAAVYFSLPDAEPTLETSLPSSASELILASFSSGSLDLMSAVASSCLSDYLASALVTCPSSKFSKAAYDFLLDIARKSGDFTLFLATELLKHVELALRRPGTARWYFKLLNVVVEFVDGAEIAVDNGTVNKFFEAFRDAEDDLYFSLLSFSTLLYPQFTEDQAIALVSDIINGLFPLSSLSVEPKLGSEERRTVALKVLERLCERFMGARDKAFTELGVHHRDTSWRKPGIEWWQLTATSTQPKEYVGIINLGATCYMNSTIQQLAYNEDFLAGVLSRENPQTELLNRLQQLFLDLRFRGNNVCSAGPLLNHLPGAPVDPHEQMDAEEFFNSFLARLENELQAAGHIDLVRNRFTGKIGTTLTGRGECTHSRCLAQTFLTLSLEISKKRSLLQSLDSLVKGEVLQGKDMLECEECGKRVVTHSRQRIQHLPNTLIISLRRFGYDMNQQRRYKLNSYCEFPMDLNLKTVAADQSLPDSYYSYSLSGVIIHFGTAEMGHYYSLIKCSDSLWRKFDDTSVSIYDISDLPSDAFGNKFAKDGNSGVFNLAQSAYLLFYTRNSDFLYRDSMEEPVVLANAELVPSLDPRSTGIHAKHQAERSLICKINVLLSPEYHQFVQSLTNTASDHIPLIFSLSYFFSIAIRCKDWWKDRSLFDSILVKLQERPKSLSYWLSEVLSCEGVLEEFLLSKPPVEARKAFNAIIMMAVDFAPENQRRHFVAKIGRKMEKIAENSASEDVSSFFELILIMLPHVSEYIINELQLPYKLLCNLIGIESGLPVIPEKGMMYHSDAYLGHPMDAYPSHPARSKSIKLGFQLAILNEAFQSVNYPDIWVHFWASPSFALLTRPSAYERQQIQ